MARRSNTAEDIFDRLDALNQMSGQEFETLVGEYFRRRGYTVVETGTVGADGGVDLVLTRERGRYLVRCEQQRSSQIEVKVVREHYGVAVARGATGCFVVTSGYFTDDAKRFAQPLKIGLVDGERLAREIAERPKRQFDLPPSGRREPRFDADWAANAADIERRRSMHSGKVHDLHDSAGRRLPHEKARPGEKRASSAWFAVIAGGLSVGGLLFYLFVTLSDIGPPKNFTRTADMRAEVAPADAGRDVARTSAVAQTKLPDRPRDVEKRAAEARQLATARQARITGGNEQAERKERAWQEFYKPSANCGANESRGSIACVNEYVRAKMEFEKRWSEGQL